MAGNKMIELGNSNVKIAVSPEAGASLAYFKFVNGDKTIDVMRPATEKALNDREANNFAMYPILPYVSHIHEGFFVYWGIKRTVPANVSFDKEPLDGDGWRNVWTVKSSDSTGVTLYYNHDGKTGFPFVYEAEVTYKVLEKGFMIHISLKNTGLLPMPCAMGVHPFFPKSKDVILKMHNKNVWEHMGTPLRDKPYKVSSDWSFEEGRALNGMVLDTSFGGFEGEAELTWPSQKLHLRVKAYEEFNHVIVFIPENKNYFSVEPVTSSTDAFNLASRGVTGTGIKSIGPQETIEATVEFLVDKL